jgi:4-diphosphocytidyl-2-C-methyl-D-erythritol kinase
VRVLAPAKVNLYLWVGPRRPDGLHQVETVLQAISLADELELSAADRLTLDVSPPGAAPEDASNLVVAAVRALAAAAGRAGGAALRLRKRIPAAAGLGGASADAAAALVGLNALWELGLSRKALERIGAGIGADVPFCVRGGTAVARGAGELLAPLAVARPLWWVVALPDGAALETARVYARFDEMGGAGGVGGTGGAQGPAGEPDPSALADALARGDLARVAAALRNDLEEAAVSLEPATAALREALLDAGALGAVMTGSGPAWCGLARDEAHAEEVAGRLRGRFRRAFVVRSLDHGPRILEDPRAVDPVP